MKNTRSYPVRGLALFAAACVLSFAPFSLTRALAASAEAPAAVATRALPVSATVDKVGPGPNGGPFVVRVKNTSKAALKLGAKIDQSIASHANPKSRTVPAQTVEPDHTWVISDLASQDKVTLSAEGYANLEVVVH